MAPSQGVKALQQPHIECGDAVTQSSWFNKLSVHKADTSLPAVKPHSSLFSPCFLSLSDFWQQAGSRIPTDLSAEQLSTLFYQTHVISKFPGFRTGNSELCSGNIMVTSRLSLTIRQGGLKMHTQMNKPNLGSQPISSLPYRFNLLIHFQSGLQIIWPSPARVDSILGQKVK